jgi:hypothetical protein
VFNKIIKSRFFERDLYFLRKIFPILNNRYDYLNGINYQGLSTSQYPDVSEKVSEAKLVLEHLEQATQFVVDMPNGVPNLIWLYWNTPLEQAPDVVKLSVRTWRQKNPDYDVVLINDDNIKDILGFDFHAVFNIATVNLGFAMKADILRLYLLSTHGGVWADTTTFCVRPLSEWLPQATEKTSFFTFRHKTNKTRPVEVWFIASEKGGEVIRNTLTLFLEHVFKKRGQSLFVTNRMKTINLRDSDEGRFFLETVIQAEKYNFMPYFSLGYFFNEVLNQNDTVSIWNELCSNTNDHAVNLDNLDLVKGCVVSKQTYKKDYQESDIYLERKKWILSGL